MRKSMIMLAAVVGLTTAAPVAFAQMVDGEVTKIKSAGLKILEERVLPDGRRVCFFEGPEGVRLEFLEWKQ